MQDDSYREGPNGVSWRCEDTAFVVEDVPYTLVSAIEHWLAGALSYVEFLNTVPWVVTQRDLYRLLDAANTICELPL